MAARDTVLDNLKTALEGITVANGYHTEVNKVSPGPLPVDQIQNDCPFIAIIEGDENRLVEDDTNIRYQLMLGLMCFIKGYNASGMSDRIRKMIDDIKKLVYSPVSLGTYCLLVNMPSDTVDVSETEDMAMAAVALEIIYYAPKSTF